jgi:hypothetical protein
MRKAISIIFCSILCLSQAHLSRAQKPINHGGKIETKYDGFALETVMRLRKMKVNCTGFKANFHESCVNIDVVLHCPGTQVSHVGSVTMQLVFESKSWDQSHAPHQRDLMLLADTETIKLGRMRLVPQVSTGTQERSTETLEATFPYEVFKKMVWADTVEMKVGPTAFTLSDKNLLALRDLNSRIVR